MVEQFKYLGVVFDSHLTFKQHVKKISNNIKFNLSNFQHIRHFLTAESAKAYMHAMIFTHITYCYTTWSHTTESILKPLKSLFKKTLKILDRKPIHFHHCNILSKYNILHLDRCLDVCLIFKVLNGLALSPLRDFIQKKLTLK